MKYDKEIKDLIETAQTKSQVVIALKQYKNHLELLELELQLLSQQSKYLDAKYAEKEKEYLKSIPLSDLVELADDKLDEIK